MWPLSAKSSIKSIGSTKSDANTCLDESQADQKSSGERQVTPPSLAYLGVHVARHLEPHEHIDLALSPIHRLESYILCCSLPPAAAAQQQKCRKSDAHTQTRHALYSSNICARAHRINHIKPLASGHGIPRRHTKCGSRVRWCSAGRAEHQSFNCVRCPSAR